MSSHTSPSVRQRRRRRRLATIATTVVVAIVVATGVLFVARGASLLDSFGSPAGSAPAPQQLAGNQWLTQAGATEERAGCVDQTASSTDSFARMILQELADAVAGWPGPQSGPGKLDARPALNLKIHTVSKHSFATDPRVVDVHVDAVPGLEAPPPLDDVQYAANKQAWNAAANDRAAAWRTANDAAASGAARLRGLAPDGNATSAVSGCIAAAAASTAATPTRRLLLASDLQENEAGVVGDYGDSPLLLVQSCPAGSETGCPALAAGWSAKLTAQGAGAVQIVRADAATAIVSSGWQALG